MKRVVIVGASGMVGGYALRYALEDPHVGGVTSIGRRNLGGSHPKLTEILHSDFADCSPLADALTGHDTAVYCLGTYTGAVPDEELRRITVDYTVEFVRVLRASSPSPTFAFLSGSGGVLVQVGNTGASDSRPCNSCVGFGFFASMYTTKCASSVNRAI